MNTDTIYDYYNNKIGVKIKYLISDIDRRHPDSLCLIKHNAFYKRMKSKTCTERQLRRASLGCEALADFNSLDRPWRDKITTTFGKPREEVKKQWFAQFYVADREAFDFYSRYRYGKDNNKKLDLDLIELYTYNASVLNAVIEAKANRKSYIKSLGGVKVNIWETLSRDVNTFRDVNHDLPTTPDSLRYKVSKYIKHSYKSIISGKLQNKNSSKVVLKEQMAMLDELISKHTNLDNELISDIYNAVAAKLQWKSITADTVANRKTKIKVVSHAGRNGTKSLKNKVLMQNKRKAPTKPMLFWTLDGWDAELLYQKTQISKDGKKTTTYHNRLTVVVVLDPFNKYPVGYAIGTHETPALIKQALKNAVDHTNELFGAYYNPYQLQSDNYSIKSLKPLYRACTKHFTPAAVGNAKSKVIEPYFNHINQKYCKLFDNWSGFNVDSGSKNQPNDEYLNKIRHSFPDQLECIKQIEGIIFNERQKKVTEFTSGWENVEEKLRVPMSWESYMLALGQTTGHTNKLTGEGVKMTINGVKTFYDSFDLEFRHHSEQDWTIVYDDNNLERVLAIADNGKLQFELEQIHQPSMCIAERTEEDIKHLERVANFNKNSLDFITDARTENQEVLNELFNNRPELNDTLSKHLLSNSHGQHKNIKNDQRKALENAKAIEHKHTKKHKKQTEKTFAQKQTEYYESKINLEDYL